MIEKSLVDRYFRILKSHVADPEEVHLSESAELGRELVKANVPPEEISELHEVALRRLAEEIPDMTLLESARLISEPLMELLMSYGMAYREWLAKRKQAEEIKRKARELELMTLHLKETDRIKSVFLASMSHELRTPLNSILGFTGIILQGMSGEINQEQKKQLNIVKNSAAHLLSLIDDVLDISMIESGKVELSLEEFRVIEVVKDVADIFMTTVNKKNDVELITDVSDDVALFSDKRRVKQVLMNLVSNAVKFTDRGSVKIVCRIVDENALEICVADTGIGIKKEDMNKLFQPFERIYTAHIADKQGTGLGLYLSKKLADFLGADISAKSKYGRGSEFILTIPLKISNVKSFMNKEGKV